MMKGVTLVRLNTLLVLEAQGMSVLVRCFQAISAVSAKFSVRIQIYWPTSHFDFAQKV